MKLVPVVAIDGTLLEPCHPARARELVKRGKAVERHARSGFYIQLREQRELAPESQGVAHA